MEPDLRERNSVSKENTGMACGEANQRGEPDTSGCESLPSICFYKTRDPTELLVNAEADTQTQLGPKPEPEPEPEQHYSESLAFARKTPNCTLAATEPVSNGCARLSPSPTPSLRLSARQHSTPIFPELLHSPSNTEVEAQHSSIRTSDVGLPIAPTVSSLPLPVALAWNERQAAVLDEHIARLGHFCAALDADADADVLPSASVSVSACAQSRMSLQFSIATHCQLGMGTAMDFSCTNAPAFAPNSSIARTRTRTLAAAVPTPSPVSVHSSLDENESSSILSTDLLLLRQQFARRICSTRGIAPAIGANSAAMCKSATACSCCRSLGPDIDADADGDSDATNSSYEISELAIKYLPDSELSRIASSMQASRPTRPSSTTSRLPQHLRLASHMSSGTDSCCSAVASPKSPCRTSCSGFSPLEQ